jgi:HD-GYP domain-containing protein (c-di-GMP phosphodiesterase class II)
MLLFFKVAQEAVKPSAPPEELPKIEYYRVPIYVYRKNDKVETDLFIYHDKNYVAFKSKGMAWSEDDNSKLSSGNVETLFAKFNSHLEHHNFLQTKLKVVLDSKDIPLATKANMLYETADPIVSTLFTSPKNAELIAGAGRYAKSLIQYLNEKGGLPELVKLSTESLTEHSHGLQVSAYSVALAKKLGHKTLDLLLPLGLGALLHDIGKSQIPGSILNKPTDLDDVEWQQIRLHPELGESLLQNRSAIPPLARQIVKEHHERMNGKGYPRGIKNIHMLARIVSIADTFNAMISMKIYGKTLTPVDALKTMMTTMKHEFDQDLLMRFIEMLSE